MQRTQIILEDDKDGGEATQTITFALDGVTYETDLNDANSAALRLALAPWIETARRVSARKTLSGAARRTDLDKIREWARQHGRTVSDRGRVPQAVITAYDNQDPNAL